MDPIKTENKAFKCLECKNENTIAEDKQLGDIIECEFCGVEYEVTEKMDNEMTLRMLEEEK